MEALILCEHNWSFVKLRSVHAQIVRKVQSTLPQSSVMSLVLITSSLLIHWMHIINK